MQVKLKTSRYMSSRQRGGGELYPYMTLALEGSGGQRNASADLTRGKGIRYTFLQEDD